MRNSTVAAVIVSTSVLAVSAALAQTERPTAPSLSPSTRGDCSPGLDASPAPSNETTGSNSLSEQLSKSKGVICPPAGVDPGISVPPVGGGKMPVIPPPGTPGGDPGLQPK